MSPALLTSYVNPDLDGVASAIAYGELLRKAGRDVRVGFIGKPQREAEYLLSRLGIKEPEIIENTDGFDSVVLLDASDLNDLEGRIDPGKVTEIIDHRAVNETDKFPNAAADIELVGATATLIAEKFMHGPTAISKESATLLYGAIISNTLNFQGSMTTGRDRRAAAWLNESAGLSGDFWHELFVAKSDLAGNKLAERIDSDFAWFVMSGKKIGIAEIELMGADKLLHERTDEIVRILNHMKEELGLDMIFQNTIELDEAASFLVASDAETQELLARVFKAEFIGSVARLKQPLMRKQIVPPLKKALE